MKKILKWTGVVLLFLVVAVSITVMARQHLVFDAPYPKIQAVTDSAVIARGRHLVFGPAHCVNCHVSPAHAAQLEKGIKVPLAGGMEFGLPIGKIYSRNLTPHESGIGNLPDSALARSLRYGVGTDGRALFDFMPFHQTSDEDLVAILSYLRQQPPVNNVVPQNEFNTPGKVVKAFLLKPVGPSEAVPVNVKPDTSATYGRYLANNVANCRGCHTQRDLMTGAFTGPDYGGGLEFEAPSDSGTLVLTTPNLTPHASGRIRGWTIEQFISRFRMGPVVPQSHMPWASFSQMTNDELKAIYNFLQTVTPVDNVITQTVRLKKK